MGTVHYEVFDLSAGVSPLRAGVIGLGWTGWLYDVATRPDTKLGPSAVRDGMPPLRDDRDPPLMSHPGREGLTDSHAGALADHPGTELVAGCELDERRLKGFGERYGVDALYTDYREMLRNERLDFVSICTRTDVRPEATGLAVGCGAKGILTEKPMAHTLGEADRMVEVCEQAGVPLACGPISVAHPAFRKVKELLDGGAIGSILSLESNSVLAQHNPWMYLIDSPGAWVLGVASDDGIVEETKEFSGAGIIGFRNGLHGFIRPGAPFVRITGESGELIFDWQRFHLYQDVEGPARVDRVEVNLPEPHFVGEWSPLYSVDNVVECVDNGGEPRVSGRRVRDAMEIQIALRESHRLGGIRVDLPLEDRSIRMNYVWFR